MANRFHGNSYDDNDADFVDAAASKVRSYLHVTYLPYLSRNICINTYFLIHILPCLLRMFLLYH
jgi:hypothetical protein